VRAMAADRVVLTVEDLLRQRALRAAVLIDAVRCLRGLAGNRERRVAVSWVLSWDVRAPLSFINVCESLGYKATQLRRMMLDPPAGLDEMLRQRPRRDHARGYAAHLDEAADVTGDAATA